MFISSDNGVMVMKDNVHLLRKYVSGQEMTQSLGFSLKLYFK